MTRTITPDSELLKLRRSRRCATSNPSEANKSFYKHGLKRLASKLDQSCGELLVSLFDIKPTRRLRAYALEWIREFPNDVATPEIVSKWMLKYPDPEVFKIAESYLSSPNWSVSELRPIIRSVCSSPSRISSIELVLKLIKANADLPMWDSILGLSLRSKATEKLKARWLELIESNPKIVPLGVAFTLHS